MDDLLELLFPDDLALGIKQLHLMDPAALNTRLATRGEARGHDYHSTIWNVTVLTCSRAAGGGRSRRISLSYVRSLQCVDQGDP